MDFDKLTQSAAMTLTWATAYAKSCDHKEVTTRDLLLAMQYHKRCSANEFFASLKLTEELTEMKNEAKGFKVSFPLVPIPYARELKEILNSFPENEAITTLDLLFGIMQITPNSEASVILSSLKIGRKELMNKISAQKSHFEEI